MSGAKSPLNMWEGQLVGRGKSALRSSFGEGQIASQWGKMFVPFVFIFRHLFRLPSSHGAPPQHHFPFILPKTPLFVNDHSPFLHPLFYRIHTGFYQSRWNSDMSMCPVENSVVSSENWSH